MEKIIVLVSLLLLESASEEYTQFNHDWASEGKTVVYVAENEEVIGIIALMDIPNEHAKETINYFRNLVSTRL